MSSENKKHVLKSSRGATVTIAPWPARLIVSTNAGDLSYWQSVFTENVVDDSLVDLLNTRFDYQASRIGAEILLALGRRAASELFGDRDDLLTPAGKPLLGNFDFESDSERCAALLTGIIALESLADDIGFDHHNAFDDAYNRLCIDKKVSELDTTLFIAASSIASTMNWEAIRSNSRPVASRVRQ